MHACPVSQWERRDVLVEAVFGWGRKSFREIFLGVGVTFRDESNDDN